MWSLGGGDGTADLASAPSRRPPRSLHLPVAVVEGSLTKNLNHIGCGCGPLLLSITEVGSVGANASIRSRTSGSDLRISEWGGIHRLIGVDCVDISANQWEGNIDAKQVATTVTMGILQLPVVGELFSDADRLRSN